MEKLAITLALIIVIACGVKYILSSQQPSAVSTGRHKEAYHDTDLTVDEFQTIQSIRAECQKHTMVPIFNPFFNARRILLELLLLQHHLEEPGMLCKECIGRKHMLTIEAYALEAVGLVKSEVADQPKYKQLVADMEDVVRVMQHVHGLFMQIAPLPADTPGRKEKIAEIARAVRAIRKEMSPRYAVMPAPEQG